MGAVVGAAVGVLGLAVGAADELAVGAADGLVVCPAVVGARVGATVGELELAVGAAVRGCMAAPPIRLKTGAVCALGVTMGTSY